jgi:hypothetical protein
METTPLLSPLLETLLIIWAVITAAWILLLIYRGTLETREDDQIFLGGGEEQMAAEQQVLVSRVIKLSRPILILGITSGALLLASAGVWLWRGFKNF